MSKIHPTAIVDPAADIHEKAEVGPFCVVGPNVKINSGTRLVSHVRVEGPTTIGENNIFFPFSAIGLIPQDKKYAGEESVLIVGDNNNFREGVTLNRGTTGGGNVTKIGNKCLLMAYSHVGHDSFIEDGVILANSVAIAGHVTVQEGASVGGLCGVTQFNIIGQHAYVGGCSLVHKDVPPFMTAIGNPVKPRGINKIGLQRKGFSDEEIQALNRAFRIVFMKNNTTAEAEKEIQSSLDTSLVPLKALLDFIKVSKNGIIR